MADGKAGLGAAAAALEAELRRFEQLAELASRVDLKSQKSLERAARAAQDAAEAQQRVGERVRAVIEEITRARERQEEQAKQLEARAEQIQARRQALEALLTRFAELGNGAAEVNALLKQGGRLADAEERLANLAQSAEELLHDAEREGFGRRDPAGRIDPAAVSRRSQQAQARTREGVGAALLPCAPAHPEDADDASDRHRRAQLDHRQQHEESSGGSEHVHGHSARNDTIGSTRAARRAGAQLARAATPSSRTETAAKVVGSVLLT